MGVVLLWVGECEASFRMMAIRVGWLGLVEVGGCDAAAEMFVHGE